MDLPIHEPGFLLEVENLQVGDGGVAGIDLVALGNQMARAKF